jgi:multiple sugar transport system permease protein
MVCVHPAAAGGALIATFIVYPLFVSVDLSFQNVNMARIGDPRRPFTIANYQRLFASSEF